MKSIIFLLAAGIFILPAYGETAPEKDIHAVMAAEEGHGHSAAKAAPAKKKSDAAPAEKKESALEEEMDDLGDESVDEHDENGKITPLPYEGTEENGAAPEKSKEEGAPPAEKEKDAGTAVPLSVDPRSSSYDAGAHGDLTAIDPITLKDGDWVFIEGDERRGWFFDRARMTRNEDGSISYWQLILYNDLGKAQFAEAMHDTDYEKLGYTLQRRVLSPKENTIRTYEILAYDEENQKLTSGNRDGHAAEIRPNTMAEKERDAVKKAARHLK